MSASGERYQLWLDRAGDDLAVARLVYREDYFSHACFLAQQSIEKTLKGYLLWAANDYPRVHRLVELLTLCQEQDAAFEELMNDCIVVDQYYIPTRYPNGVPGSLSDGLPGSEEAQEAIRIAEIVRGFVRTRLSR
jgi:HEPN domain-containing protein